MAKKKVINEIEFYRNHEGNLNVFINGNFKGAYKDVTQFKHKKKMKDVS
jgi:hypothetical protein